MSNSRPSQSDGLIKHGTVMLAATVITGLSNTLFYVLMIRMLTREDFGDYNGLVSLHYILIMPFAAVQIVTARYVSVLESQHLLGQAASLLRRSIFKLSLAAAVLMLGFLAGGPLLKAYLNINSLSAIYAVGLAVSLALIASVLWGALQGFQYFYHYAANQIVSTAAKLGGGGLLVWLGIGVLGATGSMVLFFMTAILIALAQLYTVLFKVAGGDEKADSRPHYRFFWPVFISLLAFAVFSQADLITVKHFFERYSAGEYSYALVIGKAFLFIPISISTAMFPKVSRRTASGEGGTFHLLNLSLLYCLLLCGLGILICVFFSRSILSLLSPQSTDVAVSLLRIFGIGITPVAFLHILINYLLARGRSGFLCLLVPLAMAYVIALQFWHGSLATVIWMMGSFGFVTFCLLYLVILSNEKGIAWRT